MKKYLIFTSVLTLAACGGGSGGGGVDTRSAVIDSNAKITGMKSFVVVGGDNPTVNTNARVSTSLANGAMQYDLDNVVFQSADKEFSTEPDEDFVVRFKTNEFGEIIALDTIDDGEHEVINKRAGEDNKFGRAEDSNDGFDYASLELFGKNHGMQYSDFGFIEIYGTGDADNPMFIMPIAGGYEIKNVTEHMNKDNFADDVVFNGAAVGNVGEPDTTIEGERLVLRDDNAKLTFKQATGDSELRANFDNWYDIVATKYNDGDARIVFSNGDGISADKFRLKEGGLPSNNFDTGKIGNNEASTQLSVGFDYYGDSPSNPAEATGIIFYQQPGSDTMPFLMGFGGVVQN